MNYPDISLHAISKDQNAFPKPCLYVMFEGKLDSMYYSLLKQMHMCICIVFKNWSVLSNILLSVCVCLSVCFVSLLTR